MEDHKKKKIMYGLSGVSLITAILAWLTPKGAFHDVMKLGVITCLIVMCIALVATEFWKIERE